MTDLGWTSLLLIGRYLHIVCATLLVGGTLFYEMVVPVAIGELREEAQLLVFARARWVFKWIVWCSAIVIVLSGVVSTAAHWQRYTNPALSQPTTEQTTAPQSAAGWPGLWWAAHTGAGLIAVLISVSLTFGNIPPSHPRRWMQLNLIALFLVIFLATATRQARLDAEERQLPLPAQLEMHE